MRKYESGVSVTTGEVAQVDHVDNVDEEEPSNFGLDWYDRLLTQTFPASDALQLW